MTGRILVVDDTEFNLKLFTLKLKQYYYQVYTASNGKEAVAKCKELKPDLILMDVMMPEMDGFSATKLIKSDKELWNIPIVITTALNGQKEKMEGLECGADDFLSKPIDDVALLARVRSLLRIKSLTDELVIRNISFDAQTLIEGQSNISGQPGKVLLINSDIKEGEELAKIIKQDNIDVDIINDLANSKKLIKDNDYDVIIINTADNATEDPLATCATLKSKPKLKMTPLIGVINNANTTVLEKAFEVGVTDYISTPIDPYELRARVRAQIKRKRYQNIIKNNLINSINESIIDHLTGIYNRRYLSLHGEQIFIQAKKQSSELCALMIDIDNFKTINDNLGHLYGDQVIKECALLMQRNLRLTDLVARYGGDEFCILLPNTSHKDAIKISQRLCNLLNMHKVCFNKSEVMFTISIGVESSNGIASLDELILKADKKLYQAKQSGKNAVIY